MVQSLNTPDVIFQPIAENGDKNTIPPTNDGTTGAMSQSVGFPPITSQRLTDRGKAVRRADMNGALNLISQPQYFAQLGGTYTFRQDVSDAVGGYPLGAKLWYKDPNTGEVAILESLKANNTANFNTNSEYVNDGVNWKYSLPTQAFLNDNYVTLGTNQTITGVKTFEANGQDTRGYTITNSSFSSTSNPDDYVYTRSGLIAGAGVDFLSAICCQQDPYGTITTLLQAKNPAVNRINSMGISTRTDGTSFTYAPPSTPKNSIVTMVDQNLVHYIKFGTGLIIQWGHMWLDQDATVWINFPIPFTNTIKVVAQSAYKASGQYANGNFVYDISTTRFHLGCAEGAGVRNWIAIGY